MVTVLRNKNENRRATSLLFLFLGFRVVFVKSAAMLEAPLYSTRFAHLCITPPKPNCGHIFTTAFTKPNQRIIKFGIPLNDYYQIRFT